MYDVIIAGAGPAGSSAAYFLARKGIRCLLLDRATFPREKPCGGALTPRVPILFPHIQPLVETESHIATLHFKKPEEDIQMTGIKPLAYLIRRINFDNDLLDLAKKENVEVKEGVRVVKIEMHPQKVVVHCGDGEIFEGEFLIGADGVHSIVRKQSGLEKYWEEGKNVLVFLKEIEFDPKVLDQYYTEKRQSHIHFGFGTLYGYGWIFAKRNHINIGFGECVQDMTPAQILQSFYLYVDACQKAGTLPPFPTPLSRPLSWQLGGKGPMEKFSIGRVLLAGDAAGFVHPISGEGILFAIWSGQIAADCIADVFQKHAPTTNLAQEYAKRCWNAFTNDLKKLTSMQRFGKKHIGAIFRLARFDQEIRRLLVGILDGSESFDKIKRPFYWRMIVGILKGNLWKK